MAGALVCLQHCLHTDVSYFTTTTTTITTTITIGTSTRTSLHAVRTLMRMV